MAYHIADLKRLEIRPYSDQNPVLLGKCAQPTRGFCSRCNVETDAVSRQNQVNLANLENLENPF